MWSGHSAGELRPAKSDAGACDTARREARTTSGSCMVSWSTNQRSSRSGGRGRAPERLSLGAGWMLSFPPSQHQRRKPRGEVQRSKPGWGDALLRCSQCQRCNPLTVPHPWSLCKAPVFMPAQGRRCGEGRGRGRTALFGVVLVCNNRFDLEFMLLGALKDGCSASTTLPVPLPCCSPVPTALASRGLELPYF